MTIEQRMLDAAFHSLRYGGPVLAFESAVKFTREYAAEQVAAAVASERERVANELLAGLVRQGEQEIRDGDWCELDIEAMQETGELVTTKVGPLWAMRERAEKAEAALAEAAKERDLFREAAQDLSTAAKVYRERIVQLERERDAAREELAMFHRRNTEHSEKVAKLLGGAGASAEGNANG